MLSPPCPIKHAFLMCHYYRMELYIAYFFSNIVLLFLQHIHNITDTESSVLEWTYQTELVFPGDTELITSIGF